MNHVLLRHTISACFAKNMQIDQMNIFKQPCLLKAQVRISLNITSKKIKKLFFIFK